jgi:hypothetical protein
MRVTYDAKAGGVVKGEYQGKGGKGLAGFEGKLVDKGKKVLGFWYDYDQKVTPGNRFECTCVITLEGAHGELLKAKLRTKDGGSEEWEAKRWSEQDVARADGKIAGFSVKDAKVFERVTDNGRAKHEAWAEGARAKALTASLQPRSNFDGAMTYIPGPYAAGDEFQTAHDVARAARAAEAGHRDARIAALEGTLARLEAKGAKGEDVKEKLDKARALLRGEVAEKKMLAERLEKWRCGAGSAAPPPAKHAEHMPDEYATEYEVMRRLHKEDLARPLKEKARMEAELPRVQAALAAGKGDVDNLKKKEDFLKKMIAAKIPNKDDMKEFKPTSKTVVLASRCVRACA